MTRSLQIQRQPPRHQYLRAEDDHEAARDDAGVSEVDDEPATGEEKETDTLNTFGLT